MNRVKDKPMTTDVNHIEHHKVFLIAGSEPLGSAGIQADIKSVTACGGYAAGALTCIVNEDTREVKGIMSIPVEMIEGQCRSFLGDVGADCIKTGMLYSRDVIHAVAQILNDFSSVPCVVDPVMVSTAGARLLKDDAIECYKNELFAHATIITPNRREAEVLLGRPLNPRNMKADLRALCTNGNAVIVKSIGEADSAACAGSSIAGSPVAGSSIAANISSSVAYGAAAGSACKGGVLKDYFYDPATDRMRIFSKKYIKTNNRNGTGDTLASAIATYLSRGFKLEDAVAYSEKFIQKAIAAGANYDFGSGFGGTQPFFRDVARYEREFEKYSSMK